MSHNVSEAFLGVLGNRAFPSREQGKKGLKMRGIGEQKQFWGTGNIGSQNFDFKEQDSLFQGNKGTV